MTPAFKCRVALSMELGESPLWDATCETLYWVDIANSELHRLSLADDTHRVTTHDEAITCVARHSEGGLVAAFRSGLWRLDRAGHKTRQLVENPEDTTHHRFNDGGIDPAGRFWIGSMDENQSAADGNLYAFDGKSLVCRKQGMTISNGLAFSPDGHWLYHTDTPTRMIQRHRFDHASGEIGAGESWVDLNALDIAGHPDGAAVDEDGHYWSALFGGSAVVRFDPDGQLVERYPLAAPNPTMPAFGGEGRRTLFVTTAREGMDATALSASPNAGSLFAMQVDTPGLAVAAFKGRSR